MKYLNQERTLWAHNNSSGSINDPLYKQWIEDGKPVTDPDPDPVQPDPSDYDSLQDKKMKALALVMMAWSGKTPAQLKAAFKQAYDSLP